MTHLLLRAATLVLRKVLAMLSIAGRPTIIFVLPNNSTVVVVFTSS